MKAVPAGFSITVEGVDIPVGNTVKVLGVTFDKKLTWKTHIQNLVKHCTKTIHLLRRITGYSWGAQAKKLLMIYCALIRSKMDYGGGVIESASATAKKSLDTIQAKAIRICLGLSKTAATASVIREAGELLLDLRRILTTVNNYFRICALVPEAPIEKELQRWGNSPASFIGRASAITADCSITVSAIEKFRRDDVPPWRSSFPILHLTHKIHNVAYDDVVSREWNDHLQIYTDGAQSHDGRRSWLLLRRPIPKYHNQPQNGRPTGRNCLRTNCHQSRDSMGRNSRKKTISSSYRTVKRC